MQLHEDVAQIFTRSNQSQSRYVPLLECLSELAKMNSKAATDFVVANIHLELIQDTKLTFYQFKEKQSFVRQDKLENQGNNKEKTCFFAKDRFEERQMYELFAA